MLLLLFASYLISHCDIRDLDFGGEHTNGFSFVIASCFFYLVFGIVYFLQICHLRFGWMGLVSLLSEGN